MKKKNVTDPSCTGYYNLQERRLPCGMFIMILRGMARMFDLHASTDVRKIVAKRYCHALLRYQKIPVVVVELRPELNVTNYAVKSLPPYALRCPVVQTISTGTGDWYVTYIRVGQY